jgi:hypothetical protein
VNGFGISIPPSFSCDFMRGEETETLLADDDEAAPELPLLLATASF